MFHFDHCQFKAVENTSSSPASRRTARFPVVSGDTRRTRRALLTAAVVAAAAAENPISSTISTDVTSPGTAIHDTTGRHRHSPPRLLPFLFLSVLSISSPVVADVSWKASSATDQEGLHFYVGSNFHRPTSEICGRLRLQSRPPYANFLLIFIGVHQGPPRTVWQGPRRPLDKWPLLKSTPVPPVESFPRLLPFSYLWILVRAMWI